MSQQRRRKKKEDGPLDSFRAWIVEHQIGLSVNLLLLHALAHICFPRARRRTTDFFQLSYNVPNSQSYRQGSADFAFVAYWIVIFTGLRAAVMNYILLPIATWFGIEKNKSKVRFAEQAWLLVYYSIFWSYGMYLMYNSKYWLNLEEIWPRYPVREMSGYMKTYYLLQFAFWLQQIVVVHIEDRRKDHWQMFTHHIVTCILISMSYGYNMTQAGNVILCVMDSVDLVFPAAKMLKYAGYQTACDIAFGVFIVTWFIARHVLYLMVCWSVYFDLPVSYPYGCYISGATVPGNYGPVNGGTDIVHNVFQSFLDPDGLICWNQNIHYTFLGLLLFLQGITIMWFGMILKVAWSVLQGASAEDSRSDDEEEESYEEELDELEEVTTLHNQSPCDLAPLEEYVGVEGLNLKQKGSLKYRTRKNGNHAGGISISSHSDRKELLGRIGCDKPS